MLERKHAREPSAAGSETFRREDNMVRNLKAVALAAVMALALSGGMMAQEGSGQWRGGPPQGRYGYHGRHDRFQPGYDQGYRDGSVVAGQDLNHRKPYDPYPRGKYANMDRGYHRDLGDKEAYRQDYAAGYRSGYASIFHRYR